MTRRSPGNCHRPLAVGRQTACGAFSFHWESDMGWRFRHSFKVIPGVRLNLSKSGLSCSIGGAPFTMNVGSRGFYGTASLPGTGISYRQKFGGSELYPTNSPNVLPPTPIPGSVSIPTIPVQEVHS